MQRTQERDGFRSLPLAGRAAVLAVIAVGYLLWLTQLVHPVLLTTSPAGNVALFYVGLAVIPLLFVRASAATGIARTALLGVVAFQFVSAVLLGLLVALLWGNPGYEPRQDRILPVDGGSEVRVSTWAGYDHELVRVRQQRRVVPGVVLVRQFLLEDLPYGAADVELAGGRQLRFTGADGERRAVTLRPWPYP